METVRDRLGRITRTLAIPSASSCGAASASLSGGSIELTEIVELGPLANAQFLPRLRLNRPRRRADQCIDWLAKEVCMRHPASTTARALGCALLGAYAMVVGLVKYVDVMFALAAHPQHWPLPYVGCIAFWALVFQAGMALTAWGFTSCGHPSSSAAAALE
jgi:hypothetical protein